MGAFDCPFGNAIDATFDRVEVEDALETANTEDVSASMIVEREVLEYDRRFAPDRKRAGSAERLGFATVRRRGIRRNDVRLCNAGVELLSTTVQIFTGAEGAE